MSEQSAKSLNTPEPAPKPNSGEPAVWDLVIQDIADRDKLGVAKYGENILDSAGGGDLW